MSIDTSRTQVWDIEGNGWQPEFSNFQPQRVVGRVLGTWIDADTAEHAFQAIKSEIPDEQNWILAQPTPGKAKRAGRKVTLREGWDDGLAIQAMLDIQRIRAEDPGFQEALQRSRLHPIIEVTAWNDTRWGTTRAGKGANALGQILMRVRGELYERLRIERDLAGMED